MPLPLCPLCGQPLIRTSELYAACPTGHGRLHYLDSRDVDRARARREAEEFRKRVEQAMKEVEGG